MSRLVLQHNDADLQYAILKFCAKFEVMNSKQTSSTCTHDLTWKQNDL